MRSRTLTVQEVDSATQTAEDIFAWLMPILDEYEVTKRLFCVTTDNVAVNGAMFRLLKRRLPKVHSVKCLQHTLHLAVEDAHHEAFDEKGDADRTFLGRCRRTTGHYHQSVKGTRALKMKMQEFGLKPKKLQTDSVNRFHSSIRMFDTLYHNRHAIQLDWRECPLTDLDWKMMPYLSAILAPVKRIAESLSSDREPNLADVLTSIEALRRSDVPKSDPIKRPLPLPMPSQVTKFHSALLAAIETRLVKYDDEEEQTTGIVYSPLAEAATFVDPRQRRFTGLDKDEKTREAIKARALQFVRHAIERERKSVLPAVPPPAPAEAAPVTAKKKKEEPKSVYARNKAAINPYARHSADGMDQVGLYANGLEVSDNEDVLTWWWTHRKEFSEMIPIVMSLLAVPPTTIPSERAFSKATQIIDGAHNMRSNMDPERGRQLVMLYANIDLLTSAPLTALVLPKRRLRAAQA